ncbi:Uncharacterised protein [Cedecea neteri]|uniref:Uncharacterized protein n=1 Tax=Cedecea neteri TaxID=158822 RepID=A0A2X3J891_9ENTR|nr:Uncharacterised protein [Cedecea neteri]
MITGASSSKVCQTCSTRFTKAVHQTLCLTFGQSKLMSSIATAHALFNN